MIPEKEGRPRSADLKSFTEFLVIHTRNHGKPAGSIGLAQVQVKRLGLLLSCVCLSVSTGARPRSIASLIEEAYQKNPNVHFYEQEIAVARGGRRTAGTWPNPYLSGQIGGKSTTLWVENISVPAPSGQCR